MYNFADGELIGKSSVFIYSFNAYYTSLFHLIYQNVTVHVLTILHIISRQALAFNVTFLYLLFSPL